MVVCAFYVCVCVECSVFFFPYPQQERNSSEIHPGGWLCPCAGCMCYRMALALCGEQTLILPALQTKSWRDRDLVLSICFFGGWEFAMEKKQQPLVIQRFNMFFGWNFWCIGKKNSSLVGWFSSWPFLGWWVQHDLQWSGILKGHGLKITWRGFFKTSQQRRAAKT